MTPVHVHSSDWTSTQTNSLHWDRLHKQSSLGHEALRASQFARDVASQLNAPSRILELGCGMGGDAVYFNQCGHTVLATDISEVALAQARNAWKSCGIDFQRQDMAAPLAFQAASFDVVYARLSMHYLGDLETCRLFREVTRVLQPGGHLFFSCKSVDDPLYGRGDLVERHMYSLDGHIRHFFDEKYVEEVITKSDGLSLRQVKQNSTLIYGFPSATLEVHAQAYTE